jgi:hypothetical protein
MFWLVAGLEGRPNMAMHFSGGDRAAAARKAAKGRLFGTVGSAGGPPCGAHITPVGAGRQKSSLTGYFH